MTPTPHPSPGPDPAIAFIPASNRIDSRVRIDLLAESTLPPERVLEAAARDFSARRAKVWLNVKTAHLLIHERGESFAEVTEGTWVLGLFWERNRYEWPEPGSVKATVIDSNIFQPGSTWELRATANEGGSQVQLILNRGFRRGLKGRFASAVHHTLGNFVWAMCLRRALAAIEKQSA